MPSHHTCVLRFFFSFCLVIVIFITGKQKVALIFHLTWITQFTQYSSTCVLVNLSACIKRDRVSNLNCTINDLYGATTFTLTWLSVSRSFEKSKTLVILVFLLLFVVCQENNPVRLFIDWLLDWFLDLLGWSVRRHYCIVSHVQFAVRCEEEIQFCAKSYRGEKSSR